MKQLINLFFSRPVKTGVYCAMVFAFLVGLYSAPAAAQYRSFSGGGSGGGSSSGPELEAVETDIDGGAITIGSTAYIVVLFRNSGSTPVEVGAINLYPSSTVSAAVSLNQCSRGPLPAGADCAITVAISGLQVGSYRLELLVDHNGRTRLATASVKGSVEAGGDQQSGQNELEIWPQAVEFGAVSNSIEQVRSVTIRNKTSETITIQEIDLEASSKAGFDYNTTCSELRPGAACVATVTWAPRTRGEFFGGLVLRHSGITGISRVDISGQYEPENATDALIYPSSMPDTGLLVSDKSQLDFGSNVESVSSMTASMVNMGDSALVIRNIRLSGSENGLSLSRSGCRAGIELLPTEACPLTISWAPVREGPLLDDLQIHHTGARGMLVLPVRGDADSAVTRDSSARLVSSSNEDEGGFELSPNLDGYVVTSLSQRNAVISGPVGTLIVRNGEDVVIGGVSWTADVLATGVALDNGVERILLVFDRSLTPHKKSNSSSDNSNDSNDDN
jgi:hypothetical protein